jgi:sugar O-acyltransferase (sialic acid O-acetyltransferase NeuD family)
MTKRLAIIGSGDLGQLIAHHALKDGHYEVLGFFDDFAPAGVYISGIPVIGKVTEAGGAYKAGRFDCLMIGIGYKHMGVRKALFESLKGIIPFGKILHSSSYIDPSARIGEGVFILPGCTLDKDVVLGDNVLLNTAVVIAHDTTVESHCFLSPSVNLAGKILVKECCVIGINATVIDHITIGKNIQIGGGAVVIDDLEQPGLYVGIPAKLKKSIQSDNI